MRYFLRFWGGVFAFICVCSADNLQKFIDSIVILQERFDANQISAARYWFHAFTQNTLTEKDIEEIYQVETPSRESILKMSKEDCVSSSRKFLAKILLLALQGYPEKSGELLNGIDLFLLRTDIPPIVPKCRLWVMLWNCIGFSNQYKRVALCLRLLKERGCKITFEYYERLWEELHMRVWEGSIKTDEDVVDFCDHLWKTKTLS